MVEESSNKSKSRRGAPQKQEQELVIRAPDGGYSWVVLVASFFVSFIIDGVMYSFGIILNEIKRATGEREDICNLLNGLNSGFLFCSGPIVSALVNQLGCRTVVMVGGTFTAAMYMLSIFVPSVYLMLVTYGVMGGISTGCTYITSLIVVAQYFDKKRGVATGITMAGSGVGSFVFAPLIGYLVDVYSWQFAFSVCACIILQTVICGALMRPLKPEPAVRLAPKQLELKDLKSTDEVFDETSSKKAAGAVPGTSADPTSQVVEGFMGSMHSLPPAERPDKFYERNSCCRITVGILKEMTNFSLLCQNFGFLLIVFSNFFVFSGFFTPFLYITKIATDNGISPEKASFLISIVGIVNIPMRMLFGFIADRRFIAPINLNSFSIAISTVGLFLYFKLQYHFWSNVIFAVLLAIGIAGVNCLTTMYLVDLVGMKKFSNATGIVNLFRGFGCFIGPFVSGLISKRFGRVECFFFSAICFSIGLVLSVLVSLRSMLCPPKADDDEENENGVERNPLNS